ncbi:MAG: response regulator [Firmicutes bacterium]|nr:response regulator [Bacillota bacterium]
MRDLVKEIKQKIFKDNTAFFAICGDLDLGYFSINLMDQSIWLDDKSASFFKYDHSQIIILNDLFQKLNLKSKTILEETLQNLKNSMSELTCEIDMDSSQFQLYFKASTENISLNQINGFIYSKVMIENPKNENKMSILSNMTHEIRTPVNAIKGYSELLEETELNDEQKGYLAHIQDTSKHLSKIVNDILDYSKLEAGKMLIETSPFKIDKLLDEVHSMLKEQTKQKQLYLDVMNVDCPNTMIGDSYRIRQILINFVSNAAKFTDIGGISLTCNVLHAINDHQLMLNFKVKDTGIGISLNDQTKVFKAFNQANVATSRLYGGTGLGLNISMKIAQLMGGTISVESKINEGSTFTLTIPLDYNPITQNLESNIDKKPRIGSRILLVEDNPLNQRLSERILTNLGMKVTIASNGLHATTLEKEKHFDLILMDIHMPIMDGYDATRIIRKHNQKVPIIAMSSDALYDEKDILDALGINDSVEKPVDPNLLLKILSQWIPET